MDIMDNTNDIRYLADGIAVSNDTRKTGLNNNDLIIGTSGSGKTGGYVVPNIQNISGSMVVSDTKGQLCKMFKSELETKGYEVHTIEFVNPINSCGYNPFDGIRRYDDGSYCEQDVLTVAHTIMPAWDWHEPFWEKSAAGYIAFLIAYCLEALPSDTIKHKVVNDYVDGTEKLICEDNLKNNASHRTLPLIPHIEKLLLEEKQKQEYYSSILLTGYNTDYSDYICKDNFGNLITPNFVTDHFRYVIKKHGMKKLRFHDLRHSCASLLLANGISMKQIQEWLGHSTYNVTANFYSHLEYNSKIASADTISSVLG